MRILALLLLLPPLVMAGPEQSEAELAKRNMRFRAALKLAAHNNEAERAKATTEMEALGREGLAAACSWLGHNHLESRPSRPVAALDWFLRGANLGGRESQYQAAELLRKSPAPVRRDMNRAQKLYEQSAAQDYGPAETALGFMFLRSDGVRRDDKKAFAWFSRGAANEDAEGQLQLAKLYELGRGTRKDLREAAKWYEAAGGEIVEAAFRFAQMCDEGLGVKADRAKAIQWYERVATRGATDNAYRIRARRRLKELGR